MNRIFLSILITFILIEQIRWSECVPLSDGDTKKKSPVESTPELEQLVKKLHNHKLSSADLASFRNLVTDRIKMMPSRSKVEDGRKPNSGNVSAEPGSGQQNSLLKSLFSEGLFSKVPQTPVEYSKLEEIYNYLAHQATR